jgi:non-canonical (house-cleaning) NTP pyrophosphatase
MEAFAWVVILSNNKTGKARTASFQLPPAVVKLIDQGMELGHADDLVFKRDNSKQKNGAVGILTNDLIDRVSYYEPAVVMALIPFLNIDLYP